eukprot:m.582792 g.582792  ORF g.582792 m.582792 type:complete len:899 (+) comp57948_c0_seq2:83-2779(+)
MASKFKTPKSAPAAAAPKKNIDDELGFSSNEELGSDVESSSGSEKETESSSNSTPGFFILQHRSAQQNLKDLTEQKRKLTEELAKKTQQVQSLTEQLNRTTAMNKTQLTILKAAQQRQLDEKEELASTLQISMQEIAGGEAKAQGVRQLVEQIKKLSEEKRVAFEKGESVEGQLKLVQSEYEDLQKRSSERISSLEGQLVTQKTQLEPTAVAQRANDAVQANNDQLKLENERLTKQLREAESQAIKKAAVESTGVSSAEVLKLESQLRTTKNDLEDARAELNRIRASASGTEKDKAQLQQQLSNEITTLKQENRSLSSQVTDLTEQLKQSQEAYQRSDKAMSELRDSLKSEMSKMATQFSAGEDVKKSIEQRLQSSQQELATVRAELKSETSTHQATKSQLADAHTEVKSLKGQIEKISTDSSNKLESEKQASERKIAEVKAQAATEVEAARKKAVEDMRDLRSKMDGLNAKVRPMIGTIKVIAAAYKALKRETTELQSAIAPAIKQAKRDLLQTLADVDREYKEMLKKYKKEMALRKKLHNDLVDARGAIRVFCRVRPIISEDGDGPDTKNVFSFDKDDENFLTVDNKGKPQPFEMDTVFTPASTQEQVFEAARDLIMSVVDGYNVCIFAYGQTGSGKTFTMDGSPSQPGLNRRALANLFTVCEERKADWSYLIEISVLEIYNEKIRDLLSDDPKQNLEIRHGKSGPYAEGLSQHRVSSQADVIELMSLSKKHRAVSSHAMNGESSRSHSVLTVTVTGTNLSTGTETIGKLNLIDLAGSERVDKSGVADDKKMFDEARNINMSLSCLGDVIHALGAKQKHIPYRNSKLTHLLQDSLGGQAKTLMVVQCSPVLKNLQETVCSLLFAQRVRAVELGASKKNVDSTEVAALKKRIKELGG